MRSAFILAACLCLVATSAAFSIDSTPVKVTHRNSGPRYDLEEEVDKSKLTAVSQTEPEASEQPASSIAAGNKKQEESNEEADSADQMPIGRISIRRIFLVPIARPRPDWQEGDGESADERSPERPTMSAKPFWPFLTPMRHGHQSHHLFGADDASRSPSEMRPLFQRTPEERPEREGERDSEPQEPRLRELDPIQMMIEMMQQAINSQLAPAPNSPDLNKEASSRGDGKPESEKPSEERPKMPTEVAKPSATNETREDIVEIEGKKYLRKAVINRHVGENIIFMTKRLIFVPLNETDSASEQPSVPTTTTVAPTTVSEIQTSSVATAAEIPAEENKSPAEKPIEETTTTTTTTTTAAPSTESKSEEESTTKPSLVERVSEAIGKAERMIENTDSVTSSSTTTSTTEKPASS